MWLQSVPLCWAVSMPTSARAGRCCHLSGALQCLGLLGIFLCLESVTSHYQTQAEKRGYILRGKMYESCIKTKQSRKTKEKLSAYVCLLNDSLLAITHGPHTPTHSQQMPSSALCEAGPRHTMWVEVEVQRSVSHGITLKLPCPDLSEQTHNTKTPVPGSITPLRLRFPSYFLLRMPEEKK